MFQTLKDYGVHVYQLHTSIVSSKIRRQ